MSQSILTQFVIEIYHNVVCACSYYSFMYALDNKGQKASSIAERLHESIVNKCVIGSDCMNDKDDLNKIIGDKIGSFL